MLNCPLLAVIFVPAIALTKSAIDSLLLPSEFEASIKPILSLATSTVDGDKLPKSVLPPPPPPALVPFTNTIDTVERPPSESEFCNAIGSSDDASILPTILTYEPLSKKVVDTPPPYAKSGS